MELKDFIGKCVIRTRDNQRQFITGITSPEISTQTVDKVYGTYICFCWPTINGDPFTNGYLRFENESLTEPFKKAFDAYSRTKDAFWEEYGYWMRRD